MNPNEPQPEAQHPQTTQPQQQASSTATPPVPSPANAISSPQPSPTSTPTQPAGHSRPKSNALVLTIVIASVLFVLAAAGAVLAYRHTNQKNTVASNSTSVQRKSSTAPASKSPAYCTPIAAASLSKTSAETSYRSFVKAVVAQDQTCADDQSSSFFLSQSKQEFGSSDGKWITAQPQGIRPIWKDLAQLPTTFSDSGFTQTAYSRPIILGQPSSNSETAKGTTLSYPVDISKYTGSTTEKWQVSISFVLLNGKIQVDDLVVKPQP